MLSTTTPVLESLDAAAYVRCKIHSLEHIRDDFLCRGWVVKLRYTVLPRPCRSSYRDTTQVYGVVPRAYLSQGRAAQIPYAKFESAKL
jgi:hypothetical protein